MLSAVTMYPGFSRARPQAPARRLRPVLTRDTRRDLAPLVLELADANGIPPRLLVALCISEGGLNEHAERWGGGCDVSFGLAQQSVCFVSERIPGVTPPAGDRPSDADILRIRDWYWDAARALTDAAWRLKANLDRAQGDELLALCYWNAPGLNWDSPTLDGEHRANRENYRRSLKEAASYEVETLPNSGRVVRPVAPVVAVNEWAREPYDTQGEYALYRGATCSAAALAAVLCAYGIPTNISAALRRIRATGDDVTPDLGLLNLRGQAVALAEALTAAGIPATQHPAGTWSREDLAAVLLGGRPAILQMHNYLGRGIGHFLTLSGLTPDGVTVADPNMARTSYRWVDLYAESGGGAAVWPD